MLVVKATQMAKWCDVDLKTIHNWVGKGQIPHFRTPGRHLRFKAEDARAFLAKYGYPIPAELAEAASKESGGEALAAGGAA